MLFLIFGLQISLLATCLLSRKANSFHLADTSNFPDLMFATKAITDQTVSAIDALRQASVPMTLDSALSIGISEVFAGATAGAITRRTADLLGDKKKDTFRTKVSTTGAFFGARGLARGLAR